MELEKDTGAGVEDDADADFKIGGKVVQVGFREAGLGEWIGEYINIIFIMRESRILRSGGPLARGYWCYFILFH